MRDYFSLLGNRATRVGRICSVTGSFASEFNSTSRSKVSRRETNRFESGKLHLERPHHGSAESRCLELDTLRNAPSEQLLDPAILPREVWDFGGRKNIKAPGIKMQRPVLEAPQRAYNAEEFIADTLRSALVQTWPNEK
jgi:hypothetical protein